MNIFKKFFKCYLSLLLFFTVYTSIIKAIDIVELQLDGSYKITSDSNIKINNIKDVDGYILTLIDKEQKPLKNFILKFFPTNLDAVKFISTVLGKDYKPVINYSDGKQFVAMYAVTTVYHSHENGTPCNKDCKELYSYYLIVENKI